MQAFRAVWSDKLFESCASDNSCSLGVDSVAIYQTWSRSDGGSNPSGSSSVVEGDTLGVLTVGSPFVSGHLWLVGWSSISSSSLSSWVLPSLKRASLRQSRDQKLLSLGSCVLNFDTGRALLDTGRAFRFLILNYYNFFALLSTCLIIGWIENRFSVIKLWRRWNHNVEWTLDLVTGVISCANLAENWTWVGISYSVVCVPEDFDSGHWAVKCDSRWRWVQWWWPSKLNWLAGGGHEVGKRDD